MLFIGKFSTKVAKALASCCFVSIGNLNISKTNPHSPAFVDISKQSYIDRKEERPTAISPMLKFVGIEGLQWCCV